MNGYTFGPWPVDLHEQSEQKKREESALDKKLTPLEIDYTENTGVFNGAFTSRYATTLYNCECEDFRRRKVPCKHIYRLAMELELFPGLDKAKSINPKELTARDMEESLNVDDVLKIISILSEEDQVSFAYICYQCGNQNKNGPVEVEGPLIDWLISAGLLSRDMSADNSLRYMKKADIVRIFGDKCGIDPKKKKTEIVRDLSKKISYADIPKEFRRGLVYLDSKIDRDAIRIQRKINKLHPQPKEVLIFE